MLYVRKIKESKLYRIWECNTIEDVDGDILKQELGTTSNTLSFWKCDDEANLNDTLKAILLSTTSVEASYFIWFDDSDVLQYNFKLDPNEPGKTGYAGFEWLHVNFTDFTYKTLGDMLKALKSLPQDMTKAKKISREEAREMIKEVIVAGKLNEKALHPDIKKDIEKIRSKINN